ncbi:MAG TPA: sensor histidine kinase [Ktedonobacterales bacterium]|nr:sensor histidine kinase [Ktedonobacterales bacterium]
MKASPTTTPSASRDASQSAPRSFVGWLIIVRNAALPLAIALLSLWVAVSGLPPRMQAPHNAVLVLGLVTVITGFVARRARERLLRLGAMDDAIPSTLPDLPGTLYLVILVLVGAPAAIVFAIATPVIARAPEMWRGRLVALGALRQGMASSLTLLAAGFAYAAFAKIIPHVPTTLRAHVTAAIAASVIFLIGSSVTRVLVNTPAPLEDFRKTLRAYFTGPALLFQILLLSCVPLLPLTETLQPVEIEFAWVLLLTPMGAVFYLALTSVRLRQQTDQLQRTITELNATRLRETQLKSYAALITRAQEDERRRLARELHDDTAQALIALSRGLDALSDRHINPINSPEDRHFLDQLIELTQRTLDSVRRACQDLRPSVLDDLGLSAALESLASSMTERGMPCAFRLYGASRPYPPEVEVAVYRIAQEALSNALRHSQPEQAQIELRYLADSLRLIVSDDGKGFDVFATLSATPGGFSRSTASDGSGLGLMGMRERAALIGATLDIQSAPGAGTRITLDAPATGHLTPLPDDAEDLSALTRPGVLGV